MAKIRAKLKELRSADVRYISLVDRAATRIPFRVLKRDKESKMGIDLTGVFKSEGKVKPHVSALVVFAQKKDDAAKLVLDAIKAHGFATDRVQKSDEGETLVYAQGDQPKDTHVVRLSDQTLVSVAGLQVPSGWVGDLIEEHGFFPDVPLVTAALQQRLQEIVTKAETPQGETEATLTSYAEYLSQMITLPANCFKLDTVIAEIIKKCACSPAKDEITKEETEEERLKRIKSHPPSEMAPVDEEDDQKPPPDTEYTMKAEAILTAIKGIEASVTGLTTKVEAVVTEQAAQKKLLDGVAQKADTLDTTLRTTVTAVPTREDQPAGLRMRTQKVDADPRTGNFDTAFLRRRR